MTTAVQPRKRVRERLELLPNSPLGDDGMPAKLARLTNGHGLGPDEAACVESTHLGGNLEALSALFSTSVAAKIWFTAQKALSKPTPPTLYPEYTSPGGTEYVYRELEFWTSGFFPGSLYALLERKRKYEHILRGPGSTTTPADGIPHDLQLEFACKWWTENLHKNATLEGTHDLGFMIAPWARRAWELNHDVRAYNTLITAARTLEARYNSTVGSIRSWDTCVTKTYEFDNPDKDFLVIIDNMMNLDMLFTAAAYTGERHFYDVAIAHARTSQRAHVRADFSTTHLVVFDPATGRDKQRLTNQGLAHTSCWSRGQAWAVAGFAGTYRWTLDPSFLATARGCADYFLRRLPAGGVPPWDFDAPDAPDRPRDTSAALIAAHGMLLLDEALRARGEPSRRYLDGALRLVAAVARQHLNAPGVDAEERAGAGETIVNGATINNYAHAPRRWANHGLVYADYYFLVVGNQLLELGIGGLAVEAGRAIQDSKAAAEEETGRRQGEKHPNGTRT